MSRMTWVLLEVKISFRRTNLLIFSCNIWCILKTPSSIICSSFQIFLKTFIIPWKCLLVALVGGTPRLKEFSHCIFPLIQAGWLQLVNKILQGSLLFLCYNRLLNHAVPFHGYLSILQNSYLSSCILYCLFSSLRSRLYPSFLKILTCSWNAVCSIPRLQIW